MINGKNKKRHTKLDYSKGAASLYFQIKMQLLQDIEEKRYKNGEIIPSEKELGDIFCVSRTTIRLAINELVLEGYLTRQRGKGTTVKQPKIVEQLSGITSFTNEMLSKGVVPSTKKVIIKKEHASEETANALSIEKDSLVYCIYRVRCADDMPLVVFNTYLAGRLEMPLLKSLYKGSLYEFLSEQKGIEIVRIDENIEVGYPDNNVCSELKIASGVTVLLRTRISFDQNDEIVEYTKSYYRADKYRYSLQIKKI